MIVRMGLDYLFTSGHSVLDGTQIPVTYFTTLIKMKPIRILIKAFLIPEYDAPQRLCSLTFFIPSGLEMDNTVKSCVSEKTFERLLARSCTQLGT
jgi:hypothetical protein